MRPYLAESSLLLVSAIWASTFLFTKIGLDFTTPSCYLFLRFAAVLIVLLAVFGRHLKQLNKQTAIQGFVLGLFFGIGFILQTYGIKYTTVAKSSFMTGLVAATTPFIYWLVERKSFSRWQVIGVIVATAGLLIFTNPEKSLNVGDICLLASTVIWAYYLCYMEIFTRGTSSFAKTSNLVILQFVVTTPMALISSLVFDTSGFQVVWDKMLLISLAFNALFASILASFIQTAIQKHTTLARASLIYAMQPFIASFIAYLYYGVPFKPNEYVGAVIFFCGIFAAEIFPLLLKGRHAKAN